jgi:hypothetical protein
MAPKRNPVKQIMSEVHRDARAGKVKLAGHDGFIGEVRRRIRAAGLPEVQVDELATRPALRRGGERPRPAQPSDRSPRPSESEGRLPPQA